MNKITEGLLQHDLDNTIMPLISIDEYQSKIDDRKAIVVGFYVTESDPAADLAAFIERGVTKVLDTDVSPAPTEDGHYLVFVELDRDKNFPEKLLKIINEIENITNVNKWQFSPLHSKEDESYDLTIGELQKRVNLDPDSIEILDDNSEDETNTGKTKINDKELTENIVSHCNDIVVMVEDYLLKQNCEYAIKLIGKYQLTIENIKLKLLLNKYKDNIINFLYKEYEECKMLLKSSHQMNNETLKPRVLQLYRLIRYLENAGLQWETLNSIKELIDIHLNHRNEIHKKIGQFLENSLLECISIDNNILVLEQCGYKRTYKIKMFGKDNSKVPIIIGKIGDNHLFESNQLQNMLGQHYSVYSNGKYLMVTDHNKYMLLSPVD